MLIVQAGTSVVFGASPASPQDLAVADAIAVTVAASWLTFGVARVRPSTIHRGAEGLAELLGVGIALVAVSLPLRAVTSIGDAGDIGGGLILLLGYVFTAGGVLLIGRDLISRRGRRKR